MSREPRLVDAEPLGSATASSSRCSCTSAWRPEPCESAADEQRTEPLFSVLPAAPHRSLPPPRPSCSLPYLPPLGKWFLLPGEVSGGCRPPAAVAAGQVTCGGGRAERRGRGVAAGVLTAGCPADCGAVRRSWRGRSGRPSQVVSCRARSGRS